MFINLSSKIRSFIKNPKGVAVVEISLAFVPYLFLIAAIWGIGRLAMTQAYFEVAMQEATREIQPMLNDRSDWGMPKDPRKISSADEKNYENKLFEKIKTKLPNLIGKYYIYFSGAGNQAGYLGLLALRISPKDILISRKNISELSTNCRQLDFWNDKVGTCSYIMPVSIVVNYKWVLPIPMLLGQKPDEAINRGAVFYQEALIINRGEDDEDQ